jgi:hypothetical protein
MSSRREHVRWLAPTAPPCFADRLLWVEFLAAAAEAQNSQGEPVVLIFKAGEPVRFNHAFDWCTDCTNEYRTEMRRQGRCNPNHLREREPKETLDAAAA